MKVVAVGAVVEVDLVVGLRGCTNHSAVVVPAVAAATNHPLAHGGPLWPLEEDGGLSVGGASEATVSTGSTTGWSYSVMVLLLFLLVFKTLL